jgi:hypothetical protein
MKDNTDKADRLMAKIMKDFPMESPSTGFTEGVMERVQAESRVSESRPLIGRTGWIGIAAGFILLLGLIFLEYDGQAPEEAGWLAQHMPSLKIPVFDFSFTDLFSWINLDDPTLFWIFTGIGGIILLGFLQRLFGTLHFRNLHNL